MEDKYFEIDGVRACLVAPNYAVTEAGRVYSLRYNRYLKESITFDGYRRVEFPGPDGVKKHRVHRLVALAFIDNPNGLPMVDHIDRKRDNNHVDNLRWIEQRDNVINSGSYMKGVVTTEVNFDHNSGSYKIFIKPLGGFNSVEEALEQKKKLDNYLASFSRGFFLS